MSSLSIQAVMSQGATDQANAHRRGVLLLLASTLAWSTAGLFIRAVPLDAMTIVAWRGPAGGIGILILVLVLNGATAATDIIRMNRLAWAYTVLCAFSIITFIVALKLTTIAHVSIIYATVPFVSAALAFVLISERPSWSAIAASTVALAGVATTVSGQDQGSSLAGDFLAVLMTLCTACLIIISRRSRDVPMLPAAAASGLLAGVMAAPFAGQMPQTMVDWSLVVGAGLVANTFGLGLFVIGSRLIPAIETALIGSLEVPLAPLWVWLAFGETPGLRTVLGGALVTLAVLSHLALAARDSRQPGSPAPP